MLSNFVVPRLQTPCHVSFGVKIASILLPRHIHSLQTILCKIELKIFSFSFGRKPFISQSIFLVTSTSTKDCLVVYFFLFSLCVWVCVCVLCVCECVWECVYVCVRACVCFPVQFVTRGFMSEMNPPHYPMTLCLFPLPTQS